MERHEFCIRFQTITLPGDLSAFSAPSQKLLRAMFQSLHEHLTAAHDPAQTASLLDGSVFAPILPEGMVMLRCSTDAKHTCTLRGFLIPAADLRTAWRLSGWKLLFVCAGGWEREGDVTLTPAEIERIAMSLQVPQERQPRLMAMSKRLLESPVPFGFAVTGFPLDDFPCDLATGADKASIAPDELILPADLTTDKLLAERPALSGVKLCCAGKHKYQSLRLKCALPGEDTKALRNAVKETLEQYPADDVWYFAQMQSGNPVRAELLSPAANTALQQGSITYDTLFQEAEKFLAKTVSLPDTPKESGGFFHKLFHKH